jgi:hypothetical protein
MRRAIGLWQDEIEGVTDCLLSAVSEERLCPLVPHADYPITIRKDNGARRVCNQRCFQDGDLHVSPLVCCPGNSMMRAAWSLGAGQGASEVPVSVRLPRTKAL